MEALARHVKALIIGASVALPATLPTGAAIAEPVDVELVIAADVSLSMSVEELQIQRDGYMAALTHDSVINAIQDGIYGKIAVTIFEWAGESSQSLVVPWTVIQTRADAEAVVSQMTINPPRSARRTSISAALDFAGDLFAESQYSGMRRVVDVSGDGPNNHGGLVVPARDRLVAQGIVVNGLPLLTDMKPVGRFDIPDLDAYYSNCVTGGPGSFIVPVTDWDQFPEAIRRKLVLELSGPWSPTWWRYAGSGLPVVLATIEQEYDCMVGERRWGEGLWP
jgi:hypothetical protein